MFRHLLYTPPEFCWRPRLCWCVGLMLGLVAVPPIGASWEF